MNILERKTREILGGRDLSRKEAAAELSHRFRLNRKEAGSIIKSLGKKGALPKN